jgi:hypothetical protein
MNHVTRLVEECDSVIYTVDLQDFNTVPSGGCVPKSDAHVGACMSHGLQYVKVNVMKSLYRPITDPEGSRRLRRPDSETVITYKWLGCQLDTTTAFTFGFHKMPGISSLAEN